MATRSPKQQLVGQRNWTKGRVSNARTTIRNLLHQHDNITIVEKVELEKALTYLNDILDRWDSNTKLIVSNKFGENQNTLVR